jgi:hypothetical protein
LIRRAATVFSTAMEQATRFEMTMPAEQRAALDETARAAGLSSADVARMGIALAIKRIPALLDFDEAALRMDAAGQARKGTRI